MATGRPEQFAYRPVKDQGDAWFGEAPFQREARLVLDWSRAARPAANGCGDAANVSDSLVFEGCWTTSG
jgi:hypothetical protein